MDTETQKVKSLLHVFQYFCNILYYFIVCFLTDGTPETCHEDVAEPFDNKETSTSSSTSTIVWSLFGIILIIALAVGGYFLYKRRKHANSQENKKEETVTDYDDKTYRGEDVYDNENEYYADQENYYDNSKEYYYS